MDADHEKFMAIAIEEARRGQEEGEQPFGAVVVRDGEVISRTHSLKVSTSNATDHAETLAVGKATQAMKSPLLTGCTFYATCEPCPMCCGAILNTGVSTLVIGVRHATLRKMSSEKFSQGKYKGGTFNFKNYTAEALAEMVGSGLQVISGVLGEECEALYRSTRVEITR
ncbi:MAG: nucleoside deaminase [Nitrospinota bacterium]